MKKTTFYTFLLSVFIFMGSIGLGFASDWLLDKSTNNVEFFYKIQECNGKNAVLLKIVNNNDFEITVTWTDVVSDNVSGKTIESHYGAKKLVIPAETTFQANCTENDRSECIIFADEIIPTHKANIMSFEFSNIIVNVNR